MKKLIILICILSFAFIVKHSLQKVYDDGFYERQREIELFYLPSVESSKIISFGFNNVYSNYLFINSLAYFLEHFKDNRDYEYLEHQYNLITGLDPYFTRAYTFGALTYFIAFNSPEKPVELLMRGYEKMPNNWRIIQEIAFFFYQFQDYENAAAWYLRASEVEGLPESMRKRFLQLHYNSIELKGDIEMAKYLWFDLYLNADDDITREISARRLFLLYEIYNIKNIYDALSIYRNINNQYPESLYKLKEQEYARFTLYNEIMPQKEYIYSSKLGNILLDILLYPDFIEYNIPVSFNQLYPFYYFPKTEELFVSLDNYIQEEDIEEAHHF